LEYFNRLSTDLIVPNDLSPEGSGIFIINHVVNNLAPQFRFGYYTYNDMIQYGWQFALETLAKGLYDATMPLEKYVYVGVFRKLFNLKRDKYFRNQPPCAGCPLRHKTDKNLCTAHTDKMECEIYHEWSKAATDKRILMGASHEYIENFNPANHIDEVEVTELYDLIDDRLAPELRSDYRRLLDGVAVPETRRKHVRSAIRTILEGDDGAQEK
jgi:hypothetical protein